MMKAVKLLLLIICITSAGMSDSFCQDIQEPREITIKWQKEKSQGHLEVLNGDLSKIGILSGKGRIRGNRYNFNSAGLNSLSVSISNARTDYGSEPTLVSVYNGRRSFSFFLRDVTYEYPVYIPEYNVVVCRSDDHRSYKQIEEEIKGRGLLTKLKKLENEPEESFESAAAFTRDQVCPIWLGISRDIRIFELGFSQEFYSITPRLASTSIKIPEAGDINIDYGYLTGRGQGVEENLQRRLEDGVLPIINVKLIDEDIEYKNTAFVSLESSPLCKNGVKGTHFLVADYYSSGHMFTPEQEKLLNPLLQSEPDKTEETVVYFRSEATNKSTAPRYAYFKTIRPGTGWWRKIGYTFSKETGFSEYSENHVFAVSKLNGAPLPDEEISVLLKPGETALFEFFLPHNPLPVKRAEQLSLQSFDSRLDECRNFWKARLDDAARIKVPEKRIEEMIKAGLLHLDLITYGREPEGTLAPCIGVYSPIGTESSPIIQFYSSMGLHDNAKRSLMYFLDKQHEDGMIQNFNGYMVETGAALWSMGEYFRYTNDTMWLAEVKPRLLKSCEYLLQWRERNKKESLKGKGYGMIDGKVADPEDPYHQYMLNGYAYLGISRVAEMLADFDPVSAKYLRHEADAWKQDIRTSLFNNMAASPVVPLGDGKWCPTAPPWTEARAPRLLYLDPGKFMSHGTFTISDAMLGPLYLVFCEVLEPSEQESLMMLNYHTELFYQRNAAFSQPYYSRHNWIQLKLGMVKPFLKTYYNTVSALADRETYTFWEHLYRVSVHKTHEEAWFLMETRWMLYLEDGPILRLLPGIPRKWLDDGKRIEISNAATYFGPLSLTVTSEIGKGYIEATVECNSERMPDEITVRLPHPDGKRPVKVTGGVYDYERESVIVKNFTGGANIKLEFN